LPTYPDPAELVLLVIVVVSAIIAIKILLDLSSKHHRHRYAKIVRFDLLVGIVLGTTLPWMEPIGLLAAALTAILFLGLSVVMFLESKMISLWRKGMVRREKIREWFLHFSVTTGIIGIITTLLSIIVPPFLRLSLGFMVPLAFDSLSVLSALLEFTLPSTPYNVIFALVFELLRRRNGNGPENEIRLDDIEEIAHETAHSRFEVLDAIENLVDGRLATEKDGGFGLSPDGMQLLKLSWEETVGRLRIQSVHIDEEIESLSKNPSVERNACLDRVNHLLESVSDLRDECGFLMDRNWIVRSRERLSDLRNQLYR
jgi:hypothetical protein